MNFNIDVLKKKISYRSTYRGTKEMDLLLSSFVKDIIDDLNQDELIKLLAFLKLDDENLYKFNQGQNLTIQIKLNKVSEMFKNYNYASE